MSQIKCQLPAASSALSKVIIRCRCYAIPAYSQAFFQPNYFIDADRCIHLEVFLDVGYVSVTHSDRYRHELVADTDCLVVPGAISSVSYNLLHGCPSTASMKLDPGHRLTGPEKP